MIYLKSRNLLFVKPKKTAGTSVEIALSCNACDEDTVTPILAEDEKKRWELGGQFPVNWAWLKLFENRYQKNFERYLETGRVPRRYLGLKLGRQNKGHEARLYNRYEAKFINHSSPDTIRRRAGSDFLDSSFMVTIVRHPYDAVVSIAHHVASFGQHSVDEIIDKSIAREHFNHAYLFSSKKPDFVIRYERLQDDLAELEQRFELDLVANLPFTKHKARTDRRPAKDALSATQREKIQETCRQVFEKYGYDA